MTKSTRSFLAILVVLAIGAHAAEARSFMWKVSRGAQAVYIVGSVHMLSKDSYPLPPAFDTAFKDSNLLVEEVDLGEMLAPETQLTILSRGMLPGDVSLEQIVSPETLGQVSKRFTDLGLPIEPLKRFKPWSLALTLLGLEWTKAGFDPELGLDRHFYEQAQTDGKPTQGLETTEYQISRFDEMTWPQQDKLLNETLKDLDTEKANLKTLVDAWKSGDATTMERVVLKDLKSDPDMYERLLLERNRAWLPKIEALFSRPGHAFVVVGAAHVVGSDGLLAMLRSKGYTVEQM